METFLGIKFLATEHSTGKVHNGRIDYLGIDENNCPVIIEYKRSINENVINQGLYYLDWLLDHKADFKLLVINNLRNEISKNIEWQSPRLICIANDFTKYDIHAVKQINRNIDLIKYKNYQDELLLLEMVHTNTAIELSKTSINNNGKIKNKTVQNYLEESNKELKNRFFVIKDFIMSLGDDIQENQ